MGSCSCAALIGAVYLLQWGRTRTGLALAIATTALVFGFYLYCFLTRPDDLSYRVGIILVASAATLFSVLMPSAREMPSGR